MRKGSIAQLVADLCGDLIDLSQIAFCECDHGPFHPEISQNLQMLFGLRHPAVIGRNDKQREINRADARDHAADEIFVAGHIDNACVNFVAVGGGQI